jgi:hypothetical protein
MGEKFTQPARGAHGGVSWSDLINWVTVMEAEHNLLIRVELELVPSTVREWGFRATVKAVKPTLVNHEPAEAIVAYAWPTGAHKTMEGMLLYALMKLDDELAAGAALEHLVNPAPNP